MLQRSTVNATQVQPSYSRSHPSICEAGMRRSAVALSALLATALVFVACSERDTTTPRLPGAANFSQTLTPATSCDFTQVNKAANNYFTSKQDPV